MDHADFARWAGVGVTLLAVVVALLKEEIQRWWRKPDLRVVVRATPPDCHRTETTVFRPDTGTVITRFPSYYLRIWVENQGHQRAEQVQVFASKLQQKNPDGNFAEERRFLPMNLLWSHIRQPFLVGLSPKMGAHCDVGHVDDPANPHAAGKSGAAVADSTTRLALCSEVEPATGSSLLRAGTYRLEVKIAASNCEPVLKTLELFVSGTWHNDEAVMFQEGLTMREVK